MRKKAYVRILVGATLLTLIGTTIAPDVTAPFLTHPGESPLVREIEIRVFNTIAWPPQVVARAVGLWIDGHSAQLWPRGWPLFVAFALRLVLISVPFWFMVGALTFELVYLLARRRAPHPRPV